MKKVFELWGVTIMTIGAALVIAPQTTLTYKSPVWEPIPYEAPVQAFYEPAKTDSIVKVREFSYEDAQRLMKIAQAEAGNQGIDGMKMVMAVVLNRVQDEEFPNTIWGVISQPGQFQPIQDGRYYEVKLTPEAHLALAAVERGEQLDTKVIAFEVTSNSKTLRRYFNYAYTVGDHDFYIKKGGANE